MARTTGPQSEELHQTQERLQVTDAGGPRRLFLTFSNLLVPPNPVLPGSMFSINYVEFR